MSTIQLQSESSNAYVSVANIFIEKYMADANGEFVKVYLYLLRCLNSDGAGVSISNIADFFNHTEKDVMRALNYWEKQGVIRLSFDEDKTLCGLCLCDLTKSSAPLKSAPARSKKADKPQTEPAPKREYSLNEVQNFCSNDKISELLYITESYLKHPLNSTEMNMIFFWYDSLHFSIELIEYLVEYSITTGHSSFRYMDKVAIAWSENGIDTIDKAKEHISLRSKTYYSIMKAFGISGRNLAESEMDFVNKWSKEYGFDSELIQEACKRTISATQKPSFEYADSILTKWHSLQVHTLKDVAEQDTAFHKTKRTPASNPPSAATAKKNKFNNFHQRSYEADDLEKLLLTTTVN